jgi:uncharacterized protein YbgA (DUF1722 family)/uncharacterized protein YbbK (DUF523 family)
MERIRLGISACLLGEPVRFDGGHKRDRFLVEALGPFVEWVPVCPELEAGLGAPRESMRLVRSGREIRLVGTKTDTDQTERLRSAAAERLEQLEALGLCGFVLKKDSPTCGLERVKVYDGGVPSRSGRGIFAAALAARFPLLPIEEEGRLSDPRLRENFVERIFAYRRLTRLFADRWTVGDLVRFHTAHKLTLLGHAPDEYLRLGGVVARAATMNRPELQRRYATGFMTALQTIATPGRHANVLEHMLGYFRRSLDTESRAELLACIQRYAEGHVPLVVPLTLFAHHIRRSRVSYLAAQSYLDPHPVALKLRNGV